MRINLRCTHTAVTQQLLEGQNIHIAGLIHQRCRSVTQLMGGKALEPGRFHGTGDELLHPAVGNALLPAARHKHSLFLWIQALHRVAFGQVELQGFDAGLIQIDHPFLVALAKEPDLPLFQVDIAQIHAHQLRKSHSAVQEQNHHAVIPLRKIALILRALQQIHGLFRCQVFGQDLILLGRLDGGGRVLCQLIDLIDQIIIKAVQAGQPPGGRGFLVAAFAVQEIEIFIDVLFTHTAPEGCIQTLGVNILDLRICRNQPAAAFHKTRKTAQIAVITEGRVGAFARDHLQVPHIFHNIRRSIIKRRMLARIFFIKIDRHSFSVNSLQPV